VGEEFGVPAGGVQEAVVVPAEHHEVPDRGGAVGVAHDVVAVAPADGPVAAGEPAAAVADGGGVPQRDGDGRGGGAVVKQDGSGAQDPLDRRVAQHGFEPAGVDAVTGDGLRVTTAGV